MRSTRSTSEATKALIVSTGSQIVINVGSAFVNMSVLRACMDTGVAYMDTAITKSRTRSARRPRGYGNYEWKRAAECREKGITAILGVGFDPGVVNAYGAASPRTNYFDKITDVDIVDINAGNHGKYFATNFDPEINFREFTGVVYSWQKGAWQTNRMFEVGKEFDLPRRRQAQGLYDRP